MTAYDEKILYCRFGKYANRGTPPDKSILYWALDVGKVYAVNDDMQWVEINPDFPAATGEYHVHTKDLSTSLYPSVQVFPIPSFGAFITQIDLDIEEVYDSGVEFTLGDAADVDRFMTAADVNPQVIGRYSVRPNYQYSAGSSINLYANMTSTTGFGTLYIQYDEAPTT